VAQWLPEYARLLAAPPPRHIPTWAARPIAGWYGVYYMTRQPGASNAAARTQLGWQPRYPSWRRGVAAELQPHTRHAP
jgi:2-alkyl-3-oxoalkanoate reductase